MTRSGWALGACISLVPWPGAAQTAPDVKTLAKAVQKLNQRVDRLEKDRDRLQKQVDALSGTPKPSAVTPSSPAPPVAPAATGAVSVPGWEVEVVPIETPSKDAIANFDWKEPTFNFGLHTGQIAGHNPYAYKGIGTFRVRQQGRYVIVLTLEPLRTNTGWFFKCAGNVKINGEPLAEGQLDTLTTSGDYNNKGELYAVATYSGGAELQPTDLQKPKQGYELTFEVSCYLDDHDKAKVPESEFRHWQDNRFSIEVKGPHDPKARPFRSDELYHAGDVEGASP